MAETRTPSGKRPPAYRRPKLRGDLRLVYDNPVTGKGQVRIVDPRNGRQFAFTERENRMCQAADGQTDIDTLGTRLAAELDGLRAAEVTEFFRRLQILGLLDTDHLAASGATPSPVQTTDRIPRPENRPDSQPENRRGAVGLRGLAAANAAHAKPPATARPGAPRSPAPQPAPQLTPAEIVTRLDQLRPRRESAPADPAAAAEDMPDTAPAIAAKAAALPPVPAGITTDPVPSAESLPEPLPEPLSGAVPEPASAPIAPQALLAEDPAPESPASEVPDPGILSAPPEAPATATAPRGLARAPKSVLRLPERSRKGKVAAQAASPAGTASNESAAPSLALPGTASAALQAAPAADPNPTPDPGPSPDLSDAPAGPVAGITSRPAASGGQPPLGFDFFSPDFGPFPGETSPGDPGEAGEPARSGPGVGAGQPGPGGLQALRGSLRGGMMGGMAGGGMAGPMGGMRGGMMGGGPGGMAGPGMNPGMAGMLGAMRGGMGGGMGPGMMGGMAGGMGGGMGGGMMGGGMMGGGAMAGNLPPGSAPKKPAQMRLFDPEPLLKLLYILFYPLKLILWAILPLVVLAGMSLLNNLDALLADLGLIFSDVSSVAQFAIGLFIVNLISRLTQGVAIVAHGGKASGFGLTLVLGILPRFYIDKDGIAELDRRGQLWAHGSPLLARLTLFALGTLAWAITRDQGGMLPILALITAQFGFITFVVMSWPLMLSDGTRWLSVLFNEPRLVPKAAMAFKHVFLRGRLPPMISRKDALPLAFYAIGTILSMTLVLGVIATGALLWLERTLDGLGVLIFLGIAAAFTIWLLALWGSVKARRPGGPNGAGFDKAAFRQLLDGRTPALAPDAADPAAMLAPAAAEEPLVSARAKVVWGVIVTLLVVLAFQPYTYEAGGQVTILPAARAQAVARTEGEIISVAVSEGDIVAAGDVLGHLSAWDQERQVRVTETQLAAAKASLARLLEGPKPEEIEVARRQLDSARASVAYSQAEADRARELAASGTGSQQAAERAQSTLETDLANLAVSEANLDLVMSGATQNDIAIAEAEVERLTVELAFQRDELERTRIVAPMGGRVVTADLQLLTGSYLRVGDPLLEIENADMVSAVIAVPESDIALIAPGDTVRLKAWGQSDIEIDGTVQTIAPAAEEESYGNVVRATAVFPNPDDFLRSGMTGFAKIEGGEMRVWEAYLRSIRRFFQIEVWSWIP